MNYYTTMSAGQSIPCTKKEFDKIENWLEASFSGIQAEFNNGAVYLFATDGCNWEDLQKPALRLIGKLLKRANMKYLECGMAFTSDKICSESQGGWYVRILQDGSLVEPELVWPKEGTK